MAGSCQEHFTDVRLLVEFTRLSVILALGLGHVRYLTFIKKHLSSLVHGNSRIMVVDDPTDASEGLTREIWDSVIARGDVSGTTKGIQTIDVSLLIKGL